MKNFIRKSIAGVLVCASTLHAQVIVVNSTGDEPAYIPTSPFIAPGSTTITLRSAITFANNDADPSNSIYFNLPAGTPIPYTFIPQTDYDPVTKLLTIDGYFGNPGGAQPNTNDLNDPAGNNAVITVVIQGPGPGVNLPGPLNGLVFDAGSDGSLVQGLAINSFANIVSAGQPGYENGSGIVLNSSECTVEGCFIGSDATGMISLPNYTAISVFGDDSVIGGPDNASRNLLAGNYGQFGVLTIVMVNNTLIEGNTIGLNASGNSPLQLEASFGIFAELCGTTVIQNNVISGQSYANIYELLYQAVTIQNNYVGTDVTGGFAMSNNGTGITFVNSFFFATENVVILNNVVSGNSYGMRIGSNSFDSFPSIGVFINSNLIGTDASGTVALPNQYDGIWIEFGMNTDITENFISGNLFNGITVGKGKNTLIQANVIGLNIVGQPLGNGRNGIQLGVNTGAGVPAFGDIVGSALPNGANIISANGWNGIEVKGYTEQETIQGNYIGTDGSGNVLGNGRNGILLNAHSGHNFVGTFRSAGDLRVIGDLATSGATNLGPLGTTNLVIGNGSDGIALIDSSGNTIQIPASWRQDGQRCPRAPNRSLEYVSVLVRPFKFRAVPEQHVDHSGLIRHCGDHQRRLPERRSGRWPHSRRV